MPERLGKFADGGRHSWGEVVAGAPTVSRVPFVVIAINCDEVRAVELPVLARFDSLALLAMRTITAASLCDSRIRSCQ